MAGVKDFSCIGGLEKHIRIVKEMVLFPLMYGDIYAKFNLRPPRGLLFYGPPGTGKTLVASALAVECSNSERKVSFISRKGSDCLSKWVGESEKKLQKIFQMATQSRPCIIFFDEVDGLAPIRSSHQDFVHASVVSTLLALMDGLDNNSEIIVIGATNRLDAIDPALRRPGRFDRELYFPLPCFPARKEILSIHVKSWKQKPPQKFLAYLASKTVGFCGSDLQALCTEAVMCCVRRNYPQIYATKSKYHINEKSLKVERIDFVKAQQNIVPASHRTAIAPVRVLPPEIRPLLEDRLSQIVATLCAVCPPEMISVAVSAAAAAADDGSTTRSSAYSTNCPRLLLCGLDDCHTRHLGPAVLHTLEHLPCHILDVTSLFEETGRAVEESMIQKVKAARHTLPSLLYVPDVLSWWDLVDEVARVVFVSLIKSLDRSVHILVLMTARCSRDNLPFEIADLFTEYQGETFEVESHGAADREKYFHELFARATSGSDSASNNSFNGETQDIFASKRSKRYNTESLGRTKSATLSFPSKRECSYGGGGSERPLAKRQRLGGGFNSLANSKTHQQQQQQQQQQQPPPYQLRGQQINNDNNNTSSNKLTDEQIQELIRRSVRLTEGWLCLQLETLCASLEATLVNHQDSTEIHGQLQDCLANFERQQLSRCSGDHLHHRGSNNNNNNNLHRQFDSTKNLSVIS
ncbi:hypothetical protein TKK_0008226 [Trichogramma kaykai]